MAKSEYLQREEAAKKQLGAKGVKKRVKQLPTAARASLREMTGIDVSRRGVKVDPGAAALAAAGFIPFGKSLSVAAKALKPAGMRISSAANRIATRALEASESQILKSKLYKDMGSNKLRPFTARKKFEGQFLKLSDEASEKAFISAGRKNVAQNKAVIRSRLAALQRAKRNR